MPGIIPCTRYKASAPCLPPFSIPEFKKNGEGISWWYPCTFLPYPMRGEIQLSAEHLGMGWLDFDEAEKLIYYQDQKNALWELRERLIRGNLIQT